MKLLKVIKDSDLFPDKSSENKEYHQKRQAARAVVFDDEKNISIIHVKNLSYHKLPGGGVEEGEDLAKALEREAMEEIGCKISVIGEVGRVVEYRGEFDLEQESDCFLAKLVGEKGEPNFTEEEINDGFAVMWISLGKAIEIIKRDIPNDYEGKFIKIRDLCFLEETKSMLAKIK